MNWGLSLSSWLNQTTLGVAQPPPYEKQILGLINMGSTLSRTHYPPTLFTWNLTSGGCASDPWLRVVRIRFLAPDPRGVPGRGVAALGPHSVAQDHGEVGQVRERPEEKHEDLGNSFSHFRSWTLNVLGLDHFSGK